MRRLGPLLFLILMLGSSSASAVNYRHLFIVAHQDDDLLFMNPDVDNAIAAGHTVQTVYLTAGDAGRKEDYWQKREHGIQAAYSFMAGVANHWEYGAQNFAGFNILSRHLTERPDVSLLFFRLPDGTAEGTGFATTGFTSLEKLWHSQIQQLSAIDHSNIFSRPQLLSALASVIQKFHPTTLHILDSTGAHGRDHSDHVYSGLYALNARATYNQPHILRVYRTYNIEAVRPNLPLQQFKRKLAIAQTYANFDTFACEGPCTEDEDFWQWSKRQVSLNALQNKKGFIYNDNDCIQHIDNNLYNRGCLYNFRGVWSFTPTGEIRAYDRCWEKATDSDLLSLNICNNSPEQKWVFLPDGLLLNSDGRCVVAAENYDIRLDSCEASALGQWQFAPANVP